MADLIAPGAWWLHGTRGSNVYLVEVGEGLALVDTGFASNTAAIVAGIESARPGAKLTHILLTHRHFDHCGAAAELARRTGATVVAGRGDCRALPGGGFELRLAIGPSHPLRLLARLAGRRLPAPASVGLAVERETELLPGLLAVPVPGHTYGSLCYLLPGRGLAFVGDLVIHHGTSLARPLPRTNADDALFLRTLAEFAARAPAAGCPGHGLPLMEGFGDSLRALAALPRGRAAGESRFAAFRRRSRGLRLFLQHLLHRRRSGSEASVR